MRLDLLLCGLESDETEIVLLLFFVLIFLYFIIWKTSEVELRLHLNSVKIYGGKILSNIHTIKFLDILIFGVRYMQSDSSQYKCLESVTCIQIAGCIITGSHKMYKCVESVTCI